jgi:hypothetical protein
MALKVIKAYLRKAQMINLGLCCQKSQKQGQMALKVIKAYLRNVQMTKYCSWKRLIPLSEADKSKVASVRNQTPQHDGVWGMEIRVDRFLTSAPEVSGQLHTTAALFLAKRLGPRWPQSRCGRSGEKKNLTPTENGTPLTWSSSSWPRRYND